MTKNDKPIDTVTNPDKKDDNSENIDVLPLNVIRQKIDKTDDELIELLEQRAFLAKCAGIVKKKSGIKNIRDFGREKNLINRLCEKNKSMKDEHIRAIYTEIISACSDLQKTETISYLGPSNTFTHDAAKKCFGHAVEYKPAKTILDTLSMVEKGECEMAIVPFENSSSGMVTETFDLLMGTSLNIIGEVLMPIRHNLLIKEHAELSSITKVYANHHAFSQCKNWISNNLPNAKQILMDSNAAAISEVAKNGDGAAIGSEEAGNFYNLISLQERIEDCNANTTRFLILSKAKSQCSEGMKTSFIMSSKHDSGAMYNLLEPLNRMEINMSKFESRPLKNEKWKYAFFVDIDGGLNEIEIKKALKEIEDRALFLKILGSYPSFVL